MVIAAAIVLGLIALVAIGSPSIAGILLLCTVLPWSLYYTKRHIVWLLVPLALIEAVTGSKFLGDQDNLVSAFIRYPLVLLFCAPVIPALWRSGTLQKGGFRSYTIYFLWALISVTHSAFPTISLGRVISSFLPFCAICAIVSEIKDEREGRRAMGIFLLACGIIVALNVAILFVLPGEAFGPDPESGIERFSGTFIEPNQIGVLMLATVGAAFCYWPIARGRLVQTLCIVTIIGAVLLGVMADSRSPFVGLAVGGGIYLIWKYGAKSALAMPALVAVAYLAILALPNGSAYLTRGEVTTITGRDVAWTFAARSIRERPLIGYGYEMEGQIFQSRYFTGWEDVWDQGPRSSIHNGYLSRAAGLGIPALIFWMFFMLRPVVSCFRRNFDPWSYKSVAMLALVPVLILNISETISDCRSLVGILMVLSWALLEHERLFAVAAADQRAEIAEQSKPSLVRALHGTPA